MKGLKSLVITILFFCIANVNSQVGVGTTLPDPSSVFDVTATDKGVLIPRVNLPDITTTMLDGSNTAATGLLIYNTNASVVGGNGEGYYYFNGTTWEHISTSSSSLDYDFYEEGTMNAPNSINDDIYTQGNLAVGKNTADYALDIEENSETRALNVTMTNNSNTNNYSAYFENLSTGIGEHFGIRTTVAGSDKIYGNYNSLTSNGNGYEMYGTYNNLVGTFTSSGPKYGLYNNFENFPASSTTGVHNEMTFSESNNKKGVVNNVTSNGQAIGVQNTISSNSGSGIGTNNYVSGGLNSNPIGTKNTIASSSSINTGYASHNYISPTYSGPQIGVYSEVTRTTGTSYAGYFRGKLAVGTTVFNSGSADFYVFPSSRGTVDQIMQTDGSGNVSWVDPLNVGTDDQGISGSGLSGTTLTIGIENGTSETVNLSSLTDSDWYEVGSTNSPNSINDDMYTQGNIAIGKNSADYALDVLEDTESSAINARLTGSDDTITSVINIENSNTGNLGKRGLFIEFNGNSNGDKSGVYNYFVNTGSGAQSGVTNFLSSSSNAIQTGMSTRIQNSGNGNHFGVISELTGAGSGRKYGVYNSIDSAAGGTHFGVRSRVLKPGSYAGFFIGTVAIGTEPELSTTPNRYLLPPSRGTNNQIMQTDGSGNVSWVDANSIFSVSNGLTTSGGNVVFGGTLTQNTTITHGTYNLDFNLNSTGDFNIQHDGDDVFEVRDNGIIYFGTDTFWKDINTGGTNIGALIDDGDDGRFLIYENGILSVDLDANTGFVFNEQGFDRDFRIESDNETNMFRVDAGNNRIGIMEATPNFDIHLKQSDNDEGGVGGIGFESSATSNNWKLYHSGANFSFAENGVRRAYIATASGLYMDTSDRRLKKNITKVESVLDNVNQLKAYRYLYKDQENSGKKILGFIAQDVEPLFPELVGQAEDGYLALNYAGFGVVAIKAIQEQQDLIDSQQEQLEALQKSQNQTNSLVARLIERIETLENQD